MDTCKQKMTFFETFFLREPTPPSRLAKIESSQEKVQLRLSQFDGAAAACRPVERSLFQSFCANPQTTSVEAEDFDPVAATVAKNKEMSTERIGFKRSGNNPVEPVEALAHVRHPGGQIYLSRWTRIQHGRKESSEPTTAAISPALLPSGKKISRPSGKRIVTP